MNLNNILTGIDIKNKFPINGKFVASLARCYLCESEQPFKLMKIYKNINKDHKLYEYAFIGLINKLNIYMFIKVKYNEINKKYFLDEQFPECFEYEMIQKNNLKDFEIIETPYEY